jgi:hypothetical protein
MKIYNNTKVLCDLEPIASTTFSSTEVSGKYADEIIEEVFQEPSEEALRENYEDLILLHKLRST